LTFPNQLTVIRIILSPVFLYLILSENILFQRIALPVFFIAVLTDWYDGWYARKYKSVTKTGIFLDPLADKVLTTAAFIFFYIKGIMPLWMLIIIAVRDISITLLRSYDEFKGLTLKTSLPAKIKTFVQMTYIFIILIFVFVLTFPELSQYHSLINYFLYSSYWNYFLMLFITLITFYTGVEYFLTKKNNIANETE